MNTNLPLRPQMNDRLQIALPTEQKQRIFAVAASQGISVGQLVRQSVSSIAMNEISPRKETQNNREAR